MSLFGNKKSAEELIDEEVQLEKKYWKEKTDFLIEGHRIELKKKDEKIADLIKGAENVKKDHQIELQQKDNALENQVYEKTKDLRDTLAEKEASLSVALKEVDILTTAFKNLGFDVKDMKSILNKLVDGLIAKNQINLVK